MDDQYRGEQSQRTPPVWVRKFPDLYEVDDPAWIEVAQNAKHAVVPANYRVFREGDACRNYILVIDGATRVFKSFETGREMVLYRLQAGQTCILTTSVLLAGGMYPADALTDAETEVVLIPAADFHRAFDLSKGFRDYVCRSFGGRIHQLIMLLEAVVIRHVDVRLARWMLANHSNGEVVCSHRELAFELGTAREVVSRQLKDFEKQGWVSLSRKSIRILDAGALAGLETK